MMTIKVNIWQDKIRILLLMLAVLTSTLTVWLIMRIYKVYLNISAEFDRFTHIGAASFTEQATCLSCVKGERALCLNR